MTDTRRFLWVVLLMVLSHAAFAWNSVGHRVIAQIAYDQLEPQAKEQVDHLSRVLEPVWRVRFFTQAASLPDWFRGHEVTAFSSWHYIDRGFSRDGSAIEPYDPHNVVWAINQSIQVLQSHRSNEFEKAFFLAFLAHFVGDIHQPIHCIDFFSAKFPSGDRGGNLFLIENDKSKTLHQFWDRALGYYDHFYDDYPRHYKQIKAIAKILEEKYPVENFKKPLQVTDPEAWSEEGYELAKTYGYALQPGDKPSAEYISQGQIVAAKQTVLAGYRLGVLLNRIFHS